MKQTPPAEQEMRIEYVDLSEARRFPKNPKDHDQDELGEAMRLRGYVTPMVVDERSGYIVEGHGRLDVLEAMRERGEPAPKRIKVVGKKWLVPMVRGVSFDSLEQARAHVLAANRIGEGMWVSKLLALSLTKLGEENLAGTGFVPGDVAHFAALAKGAEAPGAFPVVGSDLKTDHECPKCGYAWSGSSAPKKVEPDAEPPAKKQTK